jgi:hypothetical protein
MARSTWAPTRSAGRKDITGTGPAACRADDTGAHPMGPPRQPTRTPSDRTGRPRTIGSGCISAGAPYDRVEMSQVPEFLFLVTSTALVLGAAITIRGLLGFRPVAATNSALPAPVYGDDVTNVLLAQAEAAAVASVASSDAPALEDVAPAAPPTPVRDLREPIVMTMVGIVICIMTVLAISALINNA